MSAAQVTVDHAEIRRWVEQRGGHPAVVRSTDDEREGLGILRIDFPGDSGEESLERVPWDSWLHVFEDNALAFLHQDRTDDGALSRFNRLIFREGGRATQ